jgi:hypothetical protein
VWLEPVVERLGENGGLAMIAMRKRFVGPAHTPEDLVVLAENAGVLFAGDLVFRGRIPYVGQAGSARSAR